VEQQGKVEDSGLLYDNKSEVLTQPFASFMAKAVPSSSGEEGPSMFDNFISHCLMNNCKFVPLPIMSSTFGTMPKALELIKQQSFVVQFVDALLRGSSQVFLINNPVCGLFMWIAIASDSWYSFCYALTGIVSSTATAHLLGIDRSSIRSGLFGYNGILVGMALCLFSFGTKQHPSSQFLIPTMLMSAFSTWAMAALGSGQ